MTKIKNEGHYFREGDGWKVGDKVKCLEIGYTSLEKGEIYELKEGSMQNGNLGIDSGSVRGFWHCNTATFELVEEEKEMGYEVGKWYPHCSNECPVHPEARVEVQLGNGSKCVREASKLDWNKNKYTYAYIASFCVIKYPKKPQLWVAVYKHSGDTHIALANESDLEKMFDKDLFEYHLLKDLLGE